LIAVQLLRLSGGISPMATLAIILVGTMLLSNVVNNERVMKMDLEVIWFFLWVLLWAVYFVTDGFDPGQGGFG